MFNRANKRIKGTLTTGATADVRAEPGQFDPLLGDGEGVHHICSSTDGFEHETETRTTTLEPGGDAEAHLLVTDRRVLGVLGSDLDDPEFDFDASEITRATGRDGLLSATLEIETPAATVRFTPDDGSEVERVAESIDRVTTAWGDLHEALAAVEAAMDEYEERVADGVDPDAALTNVRSRLSRAHHCASRDDYAPEEAMVAEIEPVEEAVDDLRVRTRLDRAETLLEEAEDAREDEPESAIDRAVAAGEHLETAREVHGEVGSTAISQRLTDLTVRLDDVCEEILDDAENLCAAASAATEPAEALTRWADALDRYRTMLDAGWDGQANADAEMIQYQLAWVVGNRIDALRERASELEAEGEDAVDEDGVDEAEKFEAALECREQARDMEIKFPYGDESVDTAAIERLEDKIARTEWQWGGA